LVWRPPFLPLVGGAQGLPFETIDRSIMQIDRLEALGVIDFSIASLPGQLFIKVPK